MRRTATFFILALLLVPILAQADIPQFMSYQGVLRDASGNPVPDGTYDVEFDLYDVATGGTTLWTEPHTLVATGGIIEAKLGTITPLNALSFEVPYWLGISVEGEVELVPRTELATVPYAGRAGSAQSCDEVDDHDWEVSGDDLYRGVGNVGIGSVTPETRLHVVTGSEPCARFEGGGTNYDFNVRSMNSAGTAGAFFSGTGTVSAPLTPAAVYGVGGAGSQGAHFSSEGTNALFAVSANGKAVWGRSTGNYAGYFEGGGWGVYVDDQLETNAFRMQPGAAYGYVLTSSSGGEGTWQPPAAAPDGDWNVVGNDMTSAVSGRVGIGPLAPPGKLGVHGDSSESALYVSCSGPTVPRTVDISRTSMPAAGNDILEISVPAGSPDGLQFIEADVGNDVRFAVDGDGLVYATGGGVFQADDLIEDYPALSGLMQATGSEDVVGVYGESKPAPGFGIGGEFVGGRWGVKASVVATGTGEHYALYGTIDGGPGTNYGVVGLAQNGVNNYGVWGGAVSGSGYAGFFAGDAHVSGTLTAGTKSFKIDHPLDPQNKYLMHSSVESDEMMNIYNGNVVLDERGEAWVEMPDWFEVLNRDFRYQLTAIGAPGPNLYIAEEILDGRFMLAGGEPGTKVSWMVTGVRHDPVAAATPLSVEINKPPHEAGKYLNPEAYGKPASMGLGHIERQETATRKGVRPREGAGDGE